MLVEVDIVRQLKEKNVAAFGWLYDCYAPSLYGMILKLEPDNSIASVILEESFLNFWLQIKSYDSAKSRLFIWMVKITIQQCKEVLHLPKEVILQKLNPKISFRTGSLSIR
ncbi:MAG: hypothetical protein H7Y42_07765 [Chitinophagaceae bacterium]|nr:hypothetical protein [Chitinophagaceae bacterium]